MTNPTPDTYTPGVCISCSAEAPVLIVPGCGDLDLGVDGHRCCKRCNDEFDALMREAASCGSDGPSAWYPGVEADHPDWY